MLTRDEQPTFGCTGLLGDNDGTGKGATSGISIALHREDVARTDRRPGGILGSARHRWQGIIVTCPVTSDRVSEDLQMPTSLALATSPPLTIEPTDLTYPLACAISALYHALVYPNGCGIDSTIPQRVGK